MSLGLKLLILGLMAVGEVVAILVVARSLPPTRRGPILPVVILSSIVALALVGYLLFYFSGS